METILLGIFILGYLAITLEHSLKIDKLIPALAMMAFLWALIAIFHIPVFEVDTELRELIPTKIKKIMAYHLSHTSEILIFLLGAMTIVEIIDYYNGFEKIKSFDNFTIFSFFEVIFLILNFISSKVISFVGCLLVKLATNKFLFIFFIFLKHYLYL